MDEIARNHTSFKGLSQVFRVSAGSLGYNARFGHAKSIFSGEFYKADKCYEYGIVQEVYPHDELLAKARELADVIASRGPLAVKAAKECVNRGLDMPLSNANDFEKLSFGAIAASEDMKEGLNAFLEKRDAVFKNT